MPHKYLIIKLSAIGDVVMALPMIPAIRAKDPAAHITWLCGASVAGLLKYVAGIDDLIVIDDKTLFTGGIPGRIKVVLSAWKKLAGRRFDAIYNGHSSAQYGILNLWCRAPVKRKFSARNRGGPLPGRHHSDEYVRLATGTDGPEMPALARPAVNLPDTDVVQRLLGNTASRPLILLFPGGAKNIMRDDAQRRWPAESYAALAARIAREMPDATTALIGGAGDTWVRDAFTARPGLVDLIGRTSFTEYLEMIRAADVIVSHDTSAIHIAQMFSVPVVGLFGPTLMDEKLYTDGRSAGIQGGKGLPCMPCYDGREYFDCKTMACMKSITDLRVLNAIRACLSSSGEMSDNKAG